MAQDRGEYYLANKEIIKATVREYREKNKEKVSEYKARYYQDNKAELRAYYQAWKEKKKEYLKAYDKIRSSFTPRNYRRFLTGAKARNLEVDITYEDFLTLRQLSCEYCGSPLPKYGSGLDRKDNSRGYLKGNVVPCCAPCNRLKSDTYSYEETKAMVSALVEYRLSRKAG